jgi:hypothetical protein
MVRSLGGGGFSIVSAAASRCFLCFGGWQTRVVTRGEAAVLFNDRSPEHDAFSPCGPPLELFAMSTLRTLVLASLLAAGSTLAHAGKDCSDVASGDDLVAPPVKAAKVAQSTSATSATSATAAMVKEPKAQATRQTQPQTVKAQVTQRTALASKLAQTTQR